MRKGEIACYKLDLFLLFIQCFPHTSLVRQNAASYGNRLTNDKIMDVTKFKAFVDDKLKTAKMKIFLFDKIENTMGKGENAGYQHFLLFSQCFPNPSSLRSIKVRIVW